MAIDCHEGPEPAAGGPGKLCQAEGAAGREPGLPGAPVGFPPEDGAGRREPWAILSHLIQKGTATEEREGAATGISIITQPECENNQEICPSSLECPRYISDSKQYSLSESIEHIPNNVVNATEGKPAWQFHGRRGKGKRSKRKRGLKDEQQTPARRGHRKPEQESRAPIPVQDDEPQQSSMYLGSSWQTDGKEGFSFSPRHHDGTHDHPWPESQPLKDDYKSDLHKLISPSQCIYHVGAGKYPTSFSETPLPFDPTSRLPGVIKALGLNAPLDLGWGDLPSPEWGSPKLFSSSETRSVEEWTLVALRDSVSQGEPRNVSSLAKAWEDEKDVGDGVDNEGVLLIEDMKPVDYEYREGVHWTQRGPALGAGSFGDVFQGKDERTGFTFAAKKIHVKGFRSQELTSCVGLASPYIVPVYGAVREGAWVTVFTKLIKGGSLGQLIKQSGYLQEDRTLCYLGQVLEGLTHLHSANIVHGDIKADNILLSGDGRRVFLCDFGHAAHLPSHCPKQKLLTGDYVPGTETHMAPEMVRGEPCDGKLDVWSACCAALHMLNGWHPWTRTHAPPLCLKIATEPPPLDEIPSACDPLTRDVITAGLQKEPMRRETAARLKERVERALRQTGGLRSPWKPQYREPRGFPPTHADPAPDPSPLTPAGATEAPHPAPQPSPSQPRAAPDPPKPENPGARDPPALPLSSLPPVVGGGGRAEDTCELELQQLERDLFLESLSHPYSLEDQEQMLSCLSQDSLEPLPSCKDSINHWDTMSSGIHSWDSQRDPSSLHSDSPFSGGNTATPSYFNGVKVQLRTLSGESLQIWESRRTKLADLAVGISSQVPVSAFTLLTPEGDPVPWDVEIPDAGIRLQCTLASDHRGSWTWRVKHGRLEEGPAGEV